MIRCGYQHYHMRIIYEGSAYYGSWILILSHEDHIRRIKIWYVVDFGIITQESYTKDCTMKRNFCRFYHMKIIHEDSIMKCHGRRFYYMRIICLWWFNYEMSWMSILSHEDHIHTKHPIWNVMDIDLITWETYTYEDSTMKYHGCRILSYENHTRRIKLWNIVDVIVTTFKESYYESHMSVPWISVLSHENHRYTNNQTMKSHGCWCNHMRIINDKSNYDMLVPWISMLSHGNHMHVKKQTMKDIDVDVITWESYTRIKLWYVSIMDVNFITWESYTYKESNYEKSWMLMLSHENHVHTKNQTLKSHRCLCYRMRIIYEKSKYNMSVSWISILSHEKHIWRIKL